MKMTTTCSLIILSVNESLFSHYSFYKVFVAEPTPFVWLGRLEQSALNGTPTLTESGTITTDNSFRAFDRVRVKSKTLKNQEGEIRLVEQ